MVGVFDAYKTRSSAIKQNIWLSTATAGMAVLCGRYMVHGKRAESYEDVVLLDKMKKFFSDVKTGLEIEDGLSLPVFDARIGYHLDCLEEMRKYDLGAPIEALLPGIEETLETLAGGACIEHEKVRASSRVFSTISEEARKNRTFPSRSI